MGEIDLMAELDDPCPRGCGRSVDDCAEAEDDGQCVGSELVQALEYQLAELTPAGIDARIQELAAENVELGAHLASARKERDELRQHILDIDAHATPYGDIPDEPGWVGMYLLTAGALHRALGKIGHSAPKCQAEAEVDRLTAELEGLRATIRADASYIQELIGERDRLTAELAERDEVIADYSKVVAEMSARQERSDEKLAQAKADRERAVAVRTEAYAELGAVNARIAGEYERLAGELVQATRERDEAQRWERRYLDLGVAVADLITNTDGELLDDEAEIPVGEIRRILASASAVDRYLASSNPEAAAVGTAAATSNGAWRPAIPGTSGEGLVPGETDPEDMQPIDSAVEENEQYDLALYHDHLNGRHDGPENHYSRCVGCDREQLAYEWQRNMGLRTALLAAVHIADDQDVTDWQRGYRACADKARQVLNGDNPAEDAGTIAEGGGEDEAGLAFAVAGYGSYLATREIGRRSRESLIEQIAARPFVSSLIIDFTRVEAMTIAFTDEVLGGLFAEWPRNLASEAALIVGLNEETMSAVVTALTRRGIDCVRGPDMKLRIVAPWAAIERQNAVSRAGQAGEEVTG